METQKSLTLAALRAVLAVLLSLLLTSNFRHFHITHPWPAWSSLFYTVLPKQRVQGPDLNTLSTSALLITWNVELACFFLASGSFGMWSTWGIGNRDYVTLLDMVYMTGVMIVVMVALTPMIATRCAAILTVINFIFFLITLLTFTDVLDIDKMSSNIANNAAPGMLVALLMGAVMLVWFHVEKKLFWVGSGMFAAGFAGKAAALLTMTDAFSWQMQTATGFFHLLPAAGIEIYCQIDLERPQTAEKRRDKGPCRRLGAISQVDITFRSKQQCAITPG